jgi:phosphoribosylanthranilate isomerase
VSAQNDGATSPPAGAARSAAPPRDGVWIKICGMTTVEGVAAAVGAHVDAVGFVFHEPSPRHLTLDRAAELRRLVPPEVATVAVFLHPERDRVLRVLDRIEPDCVQVDLQDLAALRLPAIAVCLPVVRSGVAVPANLPARLLLEGAHSGSGVRADWREARALGERHQVILAGGLDADNAGAAIAVARPFGVDVSSGVESARGIKDPARIAQFVAVAREAAARAGGATVSTR